VPTVRDGRDEARVREPSSRDAGVLSITLFGRLSAGCLRDLLATVGCWQRGLAWFAFAIFR